MTILFAVNVIALIISGATIYANARALRAMKANAADVKKKTEEVVAAGEALQEDHLRVVAENVMFREILAKAGIEVEHETAIDGDTAFTQVHVRMPIDLPKPPFH